MSLDLGELVATISLNDENFQGGLDKSESHFSAFGGVLKKGALAVGVAAGGVLGAALFKGFERLSAIDQAKAKLTGLGNSAGAVSKIMDNALASVKGTAFGLGDAATVAASAVAAGVKPGQDLERTLKLVADAATIGGTSLGEMGAVFNKVAASNKVQGDVINQLNDMGIPIVQLLGKEMGKTSAQVTTLASKGKIDFATFQKAMEGGLGGSALKSGNTFKGALANVEAALGRVGAALLTGLFPIAKQVFAGVTSLLDDVTASVGPVADSLSAKLPGAFAAVSKALSGIDLSSLGDKFAPLLDAFEGLASSAVQAGETAAPALLSIGEALVPLLKLAVGAWITVMVTQFRVLGTVLVGLASALAHVVSFIQSNQTTFTILAGIIVTLLIPAFIAWGVQATIAAAKNAIAWVSAKVGAAESAAMQVLSLTLIAAGWVKTGVQATASALVNVAAWAAAKLGALSSIPPMLVAFAGMVAGWVSSAAAATSGAIAMAAAWLIAIGPIALVVAAVVGIVILIIKYWDQITAATAAAWHAVSDGVTTAVSFVVDFVKEHWPLLLAIITGPIGLAVLFIVKNMDTIKSKMSDAWDAVKNTAKAAWSGLQTLVTGAMSNLVSAVAAVPGKLLGLLSKFKSAGTSLIEGLISGLSKAGGIGTTFASSIWNAVKSAINNGIDRLNSLLEVSFDTHIPGVGTVTINPPNIGHLAMGTDFWRGGPTWVGENGPEILNLPRGSQVTPNDKIGAAGGQNLDALVAAAHAQLEALEQLRQTMERTAKDFYLAQLQGVTH